MFSLLLLIAIIPALTSCFQLGHNCSSYFTLSFLKTPPSLANIGTFKSDSELACAFRCCAQRECTEAVFFGGSRTCSLYNAKETVLSEFQVDSQDTRTGYIRIKKVILPGAIQGRGHGTTRVRKKTGEGNRADRSNTSWSSCREILKQNRSRPSGYYNLTDGNNTWTTHCQMKDIRGCGKGAWTLVMKVNGSKDTFRYNSTEWSSKTPYLTIDQRKETKVPGFWLSPFNKLCVHMRFHLNATKTALVLNLTATSLHSLLRRQGNNHAMMEDSSVTQLPWNPTTIDNNCLKKGFNVIGPKQLPIKSRIGLISQETINCPFHARGVGFDLHSNITCGEIYFDQTCQEDCQQVFPAVCRIYIQ